jgi:hypothetical protein
MWCRATWSSGPNQVAAYSPRSAGVSALRYAVRAAAPSALVICAIMTLLNGCEFATTSSAPLQSVPGQTVSESRHDKQQGRSEAGNAGRPVMLRQGSAAVDAAPTAAELDQRERILAAPRPKAGPPLREAAPGAASGGPQPLPVVPPATDPTW